LRIKEQETHLILHEQDDDNDGVAENNSNFKISDTDRLAHGTTAKRLRSEQGVRTEKLLGE
jgi:hypothetical protein